MPSEPSAIAARPAATAAPLPPLLPPGVRSVSHGLRVAPNSSVSVNDQSIISGTVVLPRMTAPASRSLRTTSASSALAGPYASGAVRRHLACDVDVVLDRDRHAEQRQPLTVVEAGLRDDRLLTRGVGQHDAVGPQLWIQPRDAVQVEVEQRGCGDGSRGK